MANVRPTKKQKELLAFIEAFIAEHGYSPSYREIMNGVGYTSVATVALHVNSLIKRGHLLKREHSARSLEVIKHIEDAETDTPNANEYAGLFKEIEARFKTYEEVSDAALLDELYVLVGAVKVLGFTDQARAYAIRLSQIS